MLLPRPEIRTATRFGSRIVRDGPVLGRSPGPRAAANGAASSALLDAADLEHSLHLVRVQPLEKRVRFAGIYDPRHSDSAVEGARQLLRADPAARLQQREDRGELPFVSIYDRVVVLRRNPRNILEKSAASDVRQTFDPALLHERQERTDVDRRRLQQCRGQRFAEVREILLQVPLVPLDDLPHQAEAVAVDARTGE